MQAPSHDDGASYKIAEARCDDMILQLQKSMTLQDAFSVYFIEEDERNRAALCSKPIEVAARLHRELFQKTPTVVVTSATLATGNKSFEYIKKELGTGECKTLQVETPFDLVHQMRLILPANVALPTEDLFAGSVADAFFEVVMAAKGRTLGLFTSYRVLNEVYRRLDGAIPYRLLKQGDGPRTKLVETFRTDIHSVLLGTESFWAGVDVQGEALSCLVIDRLPFPTPDDPVLDAITDRDRNWFMNYSVPRAVIAFKQGVGRLIRSSVDRGVVVVMDRRIREKGYGPANFLAAMPKGVLCSRDVSDIAGFLSEAR